jgi:hypothetical protein
MSRISTHLLIGLTLSLVSTFLMPTVTTTREWVQLFPTGATPVARAQSGSAYDEANDRLIIFGGATVSTLADDVWVLTNASAAEAAPGWVQLAAIGPAPQARNQTSAVYDPTSNRLIMHGGFNSSVISLSDTWVLTFANGLGGTPQWMELPPAPVSRVGHVMVYDEANSHMIVFGGNTGPPGTELNDVWVLKDANGIGSPAWEQLSPAGPAPPARTHSQGAYDPSSNRLIIFGGRATGSAFDDVWVLDNANGIGGTPQWTQMSPGGDPPAARGGHVMFYDQQRNSIIMFGGGDEQANPVFNDSWLLTEANGLGGPPQWVQIAPEGGPPVARFWPAAGYSAGARRLVVAMGNQTAFPNYLSDTWVLTEEDAAAPREVEIDIKPGSSQNSINLRARGTLPVAILSTPSFNAATVDPLTVTLAGAPARLKGDGKPMASLEDVSGDGLADLVVHVSTGALQLSETDEEATLEGQTFSGGAIRGTDSIRIVR